jgi:lipoate-protein ligase A
MPQIPMKDDLSPEEHLARDRQLFEEIEQGRAEYGWRLWETDAPAVVLGRFGRAREEVFQAQCERDRVPIVRRVSGGGAVVLGRGCLNFALAVRLQSEHFDVARSFEIILGGLAAALGVEGLSIEGGTDLVVAGRKVSGHAQRRGRRALLHHGTFLYDFDPALATRYLREPRRQPQYRGRRPHHEFIGSLGVARDLLAARISTALADAQLWRRSR